MRVLIIFLSSLIFLQCATVESVVAVSGSVEDGDGLHPDYPSVLGDVVLSSAWHIFLPKAMNKKEEGDTIVLWRPGLTLWITVYQHPYPQQQLLEQVRDRKPKGARIAYDEKIENFYLFVFEDAEKYIGNGKSLERKAINAHAIGEGTFILFGIYPANNEQTAVAYDILKNIVYQQGGATRNLAGAKEKKVGG